MKLHAGLRLISEISGVEVIVVRAPEDDVDLRCGGSPMRKRNEGTPAGTAAPANGLVGPTHLGKRYTDVDETVEVLCTAGGDGQLSIGEVPLVVKSAKPLPSSD